MNDEQARPAAEPGDWRLPLLRRWLWPNDARLEEYFDWIVATRPGTYASVKMAEVYAQQEGIHG